MSVLQLPEAPTVAAASPRQVVHERLTRFLSLNAERWTAPQGVVARIENLPNGGAVRCIHFGVRNQLVVRIAIFTPTNIRVAALGELASIVAGVYTGAEELEASIYRLLRDVP